MNTTTRRLALVPRDGFFAKDGRGWSTSARTHVVDWPWPTTIRGALTTASGKLEEARKPSRFEQVDWARYHAAVKLGRLLALRRPLNVDVWGPEHRMWPVPADALWVEDKPSVLRLQPTKPETCTLGRAKPEEGMPQGYEEAREALWVPPNVDSKDKPLPSPRWWPNKAFVDWLCAMPIENDPNVLPPKQWPSPEKRLQVHVGINPDALTSDEGILYLHDVVETLERRRLSSGRSEIAEWAIGAEVTWPIHELPRLVRLGSDSRMAWVEDVAQTTNVFAEPPELLSAFTELKPRGLRLVVATPACFARGWLPDGFEPTSTNGAWQFQGTLPRIQGQLVLRAAFVPRPMHVSGWDMAADRAKGGAPRRTSRLVPPGAVYFFQRTDRSAFTPVDAKALWLAALGGRTDEGFGRIVPGIWNPEDIHL